MYQVLQITDVSEIILQWHISGFHKYLLHPYHHVPTGACMMQHGRWLHWDCQVTVSFMYIYIAIPALVNTVPADGLAPSGARPFAGTVMTRIWHIFLKIHLIKWFWGINEYERTFVNLDIYPIWRVNLTMFYVPGIIWKGQYILW